MLLPIQPNNTNVNFQAEIYHGSRKLLNPKANELLKQGIKEIELLQKELASIKHNKSYLEYDTVALNHIHDNNLLKLSYGILEQKPQNHLMNNPEYTRELKFLDTDGSIVYKTPSKFGGNIHYDMSKNPSIIEKINQFIEDYMPAFISK